MAKIHTKVETKAIAHQRLHEARLQLDYVRNSMEFEQITVEATERSRQWVFRFGGTWLMAYWPADSEARICGTSSPCSSPTVACRLAVKAKRQLIESIKTAMQPQKPVRSCRAPRAK